jgi:REP element-mobilizing transposase RayT
MPYDPKKHNRRSLRLKGYDYSTPGAYFITICTKDKGNILGAVSDGKIHLNETGIIATDCWYDLPNHYPNAQLDSFVIMPNHVHGIIILVDFTVPVGVGFKPSPTGKKQIYQLTEIVRGFKTFSARRINEIHKRQGNPFWQRNYYEHVVRNSRELYRIHEYIQNNPLKWEMDIENRRKTELKLVS